MDGLIKRIGNNKSRIAIVLVFGILALFMIVATHYGTKTLSSVRAYIAAEGQWTKAQKEAANLLIEYSLYRKEEYYNRFQDKLELHKGFEKARKTMMSDNPDIELAQEGFEAGDIHPEDIELLIWLTLNFREVGRLQEAMNIWRQGDKRIAELDSLGQALHGVIAKGQLTPDRRNRFIQKISSVDRQLTDLENAFSATMGGLARWVRSLIFWVITGAGIMLLVVGYLITNRFFREISTLNKRLTESESKFRKVLEHSRDVIYQLDFETNTYEYISPYVEQMMGFPPEVFLEKGRKFLIDRIHPDDLERMEEELQEMKREGEDGHFANETEFRVKTKNGEYIWVNNQRSLMRNEEGNPIAVVGTARDISERKKHEMETQKSLREKQTLLEEIHHRVKNNLAVISSLLELQKEEAAESLKEIFDDTQSRIRSIAMIHEKLYQTETLSDVDIREYIEDFAEMIANTFNSGQKDITIQKDVERFSLDITKAVPLALIFNELLNNAFKHGFPDKKKGGITISLRRSNESVLLSVADDGNPLPDDFAIEDTDSLGMTLIKTLTKQLEGEITIVQDKQTTFKIEFPISGKQET